MLAQYPSRCFCPRPLVKQATRHDHTPDTTITKLRPLSSVSHSISLPHGSLGGLHSPHHSQPWPQKNREKGRGEHSQKLTFPSHTETWEVFPLGSCSLLTRGSPETLAEVSVTAVTNHLDRTERNAEPHVAVYCFTSKTQSRYSTCLSLAPNPHHKFIALAHSSLAG